MTVCEVVTTKGCGEVNVVVGIGGGEDIILGQFKKEQYAQVFQQEEAQGAV